MNKNQYEIFISFLGADTSIPWVRHLFGIVACLSGPFVAAAVLLILPRPDFATFCQIAAPLTGFFGSLLWLAWPWFRSDIERALRVVRLRDVDADSERPGDHASPKVTVVGPLTDRAEKVSYSYVGVALALSWILTLLPIAESASSSRDPIEEIALLRRNLSSTVDAARTHTKEILSLKEALGREIAARDLAIREFSRRLSALEGRSEAPPP
jgi:hypothetical protein